MTQQPYYPPAPQPAQQYQPQFPQAPQQPYQQPMQPAYGQQPMQQPYQQMPQQPPAQPLAEGSIDAFYNQPSVGGGPSLSWTDKQSNQPKPIGTSYVGVVARDVTNADVQQQTDFRTQAPLFYKDGRPKFAMKVPLKVQPSAEFTEGECSWFVKGQARDELVRAMAEAGCDGSPKAGATITVTLVQRRPSGAGMNPANIVQVQYTPPNGAVAPSPASAPQQAPVQQQFQPQQEAPPTWAQPAPVPQQVPLAQPVQQYQAPQQVAPVQAQPQQTAPQPPARLTPEQEQLLAQLNAAKQAS